MGQTPDSSYFMTLMMNREYLAAEHWEVPWHSSAPKSQGCLPNLTALEQKRSEEWPEIQGSAFSPRLSAIPSSLQLATAPSSLKFAWVYRPTTDSAVKLCLPCSFTTLLQTLAFASAQAFIQFLILLTAGWLLSPLVL